MEVMCLYPETTSFWKLERVCFWTRAFEHGPQFFAQAVVVRVMKSRKTLETWERAVASRLVMFSWGVGHGWCIYVHLLVGKSQEPDFTVLARYHCNVTQHIPRDFMSRRSMVWKKQLLIGSFLRILRLQSCHGGIFGMKTAVTRFCLLFAAVFSLQK